MANDSDSAVNIEGHAPLLDRVQNCAFKYFTEMTAKTGGLMLDTSREGAPASIAATGFGLAALTIGVHRAIDLISKASLGCVAQMDVVTKILGAKRGDVQF